MGMLTYGTVFEKELRALIIARIDSLTEEMSLGLLKTFEEYKSAAGKIDGLRQCLELIDEASSVTNKKIGA